MDKRLLIAKPVTKELEKFNHSYKESITSDNPRIQEVIGYILRSDGKKIRPMLLFLAAKACGEINEISYNSAITIELLHTASLIHDDIVDESKIRRGKPSLNAVYDNKIAVLAGDFFLSTALIKSVLTGDMDIVADISNLGRSLAEGELNQLSLVKELIIDEDEYFKVIEKKTASLLSTCMRIGAMSTGGSPEDIERFTTLGKYLGICFQLRDDIFDYFKTNVGKPTGNDIREGKITLPLLYALKNATESEQIEISNIITSYNYTEENIDKLTLFAIENGGIEYAYKKIDEYRIKSEDLIATISQEEVRTALHHAIEYVIERAY